MADIAQETGVSVPTVSRALRDHPDVSAATRNRIKETARELGYAVSHTARALRTGEYRALSFVLPVDLIGWWEPLLRGAARAAAARGYSLVFSPVSMPAEQGVGDDEVEDVTTFFDRSSLLAVDGFVVVTPTGDGWKARGAAANKPIVIIDDVRRHPGHHTFATDNHLGARMAVEYLVEQGRSNIIAVTPTSGLEGLVVEERLAGYREVLAEAGLPTRVVEVDETFPPTQDRSSEIEGLLSDGVEFDAIFSIVDFAAIAPLRSLGHAGVRVPEDVAVVGFDDDSSAVCTTPSLTTIAQPMGEIGGSAVRMLLDLLGGTQIPPTEHKLTPALVRRRSA